MGDLDCEKLKIDAMARLRDVCMYVVGRDDGIRIWNAAIEWAVRTAKETPEAGGYVHGEPGEGSWWESDAGATLASAVERVAAGELP